MFVNQSRICCRSSVVEHTLGKGEVGSSILLDSTISLQENLLKYLRHARAVVINGGKGNGLARDVGALDWQSEQNLPLFCPPINMIGVIHQCHL